MQQRIVDTIQTSEKMIVLMKWFLMLGIVCFAIIEAAGKTQPLFIRKKYVLSEGRSAYVFDEALPQEQVLSMKSFMSANDNWRYVIRDPHSISEELQFDDRNGIPWKSWKDPTLLKATKIEKRLKTIVHTIHAKEKNSTVNFELNEVYAALLRRGDRTKPVAEGRKDEESYHVAMFMNIVWRKNAYGELMLYDDDGEILTSIRPKFGRIVIWHSSIKYIFRSPSITQLATQHVVLMHFGANVDTNIRKLHYYKHFVDEIRRPPTLLSWVEEYKNAPADDIDLDKHLTLYKKNKRNHFVAVFDELFNEKALSVIRAWTIKYGFYFFDGSLDTSSDNVQWIAGINIHDFVNTDIWPIIRKIASHVSNTSDWYPYDVACNLIRNYDHTRFHLDTSEPDEKEMTFLLYLSPNWTSVDYGETAFMETNSNHPRNEYVAEVVPTFGRAVIFDGNFPHSAHPPSVQHYDARYTLAVKLSYNKLLALKKTFIEEKKHEPVASQAMKDMHQLKQHPKLHLGLNKLRAVTDHLVTRNLQALESGASLEEEARRKAYETENGKNDIEEFQDGEDPHELLYSVLGDTDELEAPLTSEQKDMLVKMIQYHDIQNYPVESEPEPDEPLLKHFNEAQRDKLIATWERTTGKDVDSLSDYQELYLRQRLWLKDYVMGKMTTLL